MSDNSSPNVWLIGASQMSQDYAKVLKALQTPFKVIGRGENSAATFESATKIAVQTGGIGSTLQKEAAPEVAIVAVGVEQLAYVSSKLLQAGTKRILLEKPGGINQEELQNLQSEAQLLQSDVWLAYNRRFYESTRKTQEIIKADGAMSY